MNSRGTDLTSASDLRLFEDVAPRLLGLAYRILGSRADAEDAVQDTFIKWQHADRSTIENPAAWLMTACTRRCIDLTRAAHRTRVDYVGPWLPEPIATVEAEPEERLALASSLEMAFLLVLERLTAKERAAYLLYEIFEQPYPAVAAALGLKEPAVRKLVSRAKENIAAAKVRSAPPREQQARLLAAFESAVATGRTDELAALLADDIELSADSGGKVPAIMEVLAGKATVLAFIEKLVGWWDGYRLAEADLNGVRSLLIERDGAIAATLSFAYDEAGRASRIFIMRNPEKLARLGPAQIM